MNISWVLSDTATLDLSHDLEQMKRLGALWGSWRTWRAFQTDNVVCHDQQKAAELIRRDFQSRCNLYMPNTIHANLDRPQGVYLYGGEFAHDVIRPEEIVALHLAATTSDIVLLLGWDLGELKPNDDRLASHQAQHHRNMMHQALKTYDKVQWVVVDHPEPLAPNLARLENVIPDSMDSVLTFAD
jgi:hypothetical protein